MKIYNYHPITKDYLSEGIADKSPLETGVYLVPSNATTIAPPQYDPKTQTCRYTTNKWEVAAIPVEPPPAAVPINYLAQNEAALWRAATAYEQSYISGSALGTLTTGVLQNKPKSIAIKQWIMNLWMNHYYPRKVMITGDAPITADQLDFTLVGPMPYSVPELVAEVGM